MVYEALPSLPPPPPPPPQAEIDKRNDRTMSSEAGREWHIWKSFFLVGVQLWKTGVGRSLRVLRIDTPDIFQTNTRSQLLPVEALIGLILVISLT
jgi:hypothetical protein